MNLLLGLDIGSTTVKLVALDSLDQSAVYTAYRRHNASFASTTAEILTDFRSQFPQADCRLAVCGSAGQPVARGVGAPYIQEVVAAAMAVRRFYSDTRVLIELGGQDAKVVFFSDRSGVDMRMNSSCAGGTGAFIDQMANLLGTPTEGFEGLASKGNHIYPISGRCGVFAKTDIQPLLNNGVAKADLALSALHAVAKQTLGGLAQGKSIHAPVLFLGGPCTFIPSLPKVFRHRLGFSAAETVVPENAEVVVACGAALSIEEMFNEEARLDLNDAVLGLHSLSQKSFAETASVTVAIPNGDGGSREAHMGWPGMGESGSRPKRFFDTASDRKEFQKAFALPEFSPEKRSAGTRLPVFIGLDAGSTTSKFAVLNEAGDLVDRFYTGNSGEPLEVMRDGLAELFNRYRKAGVQLEVLATGATGYGEKLFASAFSTDVNTVETVAHAEAARRYCPDASFVLDIGGQDMKAVFLNGGIITGITLNEACSSGCGSFLEHYAASLGVRLDELAELAFQSENPSQLGSRCTVFMNSAIITEQKRGRSVSDILAGLCRSIVENVFSKVLRISNLDSLGDHIIVQGGTFKNDAVLRAFEQYVGRKVIRPPFPGEMGAIGAGLLARKAHRRGETDTRFITPEALATFEATRHTGIECRLCSNRCSRILVDFGQGRYFLTGNRCERGAVLAPGIAESLLGREEEAPILADRGAGATDGRAGARPGFARPKRPRDLMRILPTLLARDWREEQREVPNEGSLIRMGIPRVLGLVAWLPFWTALFRELGMKPVVSPNSTEEIFERGLVNVPSDTACLPAKLVHGHISKLLDMGVDRIFLPEIMAWPRENDSIPGTCVCPLVQGYATVIRSSDDPEGRFGIPLDKPVFHAHNNRLLDKQLMDWIRTSFGGSPGRIRSAVRQAHRSIHAYRTEVRRKGGELLDSLGQDEFAVVLAGRPYHSDPYINHQVSRLFTELGVAVLPLDALPGLDEVDLSKVRVECFNSLHARLMAGALLVSGDPRLEMVQLTSFGCGHEAILSDEISRLLTNTGDRELLVLKLDEGDVTGPLSIRIRSFIETVRARREGRTHRLATGLERALGDPFELRFEKRDKHTRTILVPNLSEGFSELVAAVFSSRGYRIKILPLADERAVALGRCYVHNDICFPAQINVGEALKFLREHKDKSHQYTLGLAKNCGNCRAGQYAALARKALDDAGFSDVSILTTGSDSKDMHPGFRVPLVFLVSMVWGVFLVDALERMLRALRPYEKNTGSTERVYRHYLKTICETVPRSRRKALDLFSDAVEAFNAIDVDRRVRKPRVGIVGEVLIKYHPTATAGLQHYLEAHGMEIVQPDMTDFFRREDPIRRERIARGFEPHPWLSSLFSSVSEKLFRRAWKAIHPIAERFKFHEEHADCYGLMDRASHLFDPSFRVGEGWMIAAEILDMADHGIESFVIVQPFGCLPNHISGRGVLKAIQKEVPQIQIVALDFDPDTPFANFENRLQMLIWNEKQKAGDAGTPTELEDVIKRRDVHIPDDVTPGVEFVR